MLIKHKLKDICKKQKMKEMMIKWRPFSHLLQSRAALLQTSEPDVHIAPSQTNPNTVAAQNNVHQIIPLLLQPNLHRAQSGVNTPIPMSLPTPPSVPEAVSSPNQAEVTAAPSQVEDQPGEPVASVQVSQHQEKSEDQQEAPADQGTMPNSQAQVPSVPATLQVTAAQDVTSTTSSSPNSQNPSVCPPQPFTLPLIRSKTGRLILPSSLKPSKLLHYLSHPVYSLFEILLSSCVIIPYHQINLFIFPSQLVKASIH